MSRKEINDPRKEPRVIALAIEEKRSLLQEKEEQLLSYTLVVLFSSLCWLLLQTLSLF